MAETVGQHSVAAFTSPVNGTSPIDANTVKGNDNTIRSAYVDHDADPGIHVQSSTLASRPVANSAGRKWMTQDSGVIRLFYDDGTNWYEVDYLRTTGGTISGNLSITGTLAVTGVATFTAQPILSSLTASRAVFTDGSKGLVSNAITGTGDVVMSASPTLTGTITAASATLSGTLGVSGLLTFASLKGTGATTVTDILNDSTMATASATTLATSSSIKTYVDNKVATVDTLAEVLANGNTTGANDIIVNAGQKIRTPLIASQNNATAITIADTTGALTFASALADSNLATISTAGKVSNSATTATSANTASAIVARDASGNFTAGTITAALTGNASTATTLQTARNINGVSFNGSADITVTAAAGTLTGTTLASNVTASSLTSVGTLANLTVTNPITGSVTGSSGSTTGNAATATALQTARNINGVSFNGTADITVTAAAGTLTGTTLASGVTASSLTSVGTLTSLTVSGDLTVDTSTLKVDSTNNVVGIGTASPGTTRRLSAAGSINLSGTGYTGLSAPTIYLANTTATTGRTMAINSQDSGGLQIYDVTGGDATRFTIDGSGNLAVDTNVLYVDATNNRVGVGTASPGYTLDVSGTINLNVGASPFYSLRNTTTADGAYESFSISGTEKYRFGSARQAIGGGSADDVGISAVGAIRFSSGSLTSEKMRLDASGNLGLGVTPNTWRSADVVMQVGSGVSKYGHFVSAGIGAVYGGGFYRDTGGFKYVNASSPAGRFDYNYTATGGFTWNLAPAGTNAGDAITFTQAMTLDASGRLGIGTSSPDVTLDLEAAVGSSTALVMLKNTSGASASNIAQMQFWSGNTFGGLEQIASIHGINPNAGSNNGGALVFSTSSNGTATTPAERARITSGGNVGIGTTSIANLLQVAGAVGLNHSVINSAATSGDFTVSVGGLTTLTGSAWRQSAMLVFYSGLNGAQTADTNFLAFIKIQGLSTYGASVQANIVSTATITTANATSTGVDITFDVDDNNLGSVFVVLIGGNGGDRPTLSITG